MGLGYGPDAVSRFDRGTKIGSSVAVKFGLIDPATLQPRSTVGVYMDGETPSGGPTEKNLAVSFHTGGPIRVTVEYSSGTINISVIDVATKHRDAGVFHVDLPSHTGADAYVGFTGGTGGKTSTQEILAWDFTQAIT
jgi:Legume lectin domain